MAKLVLRLSKRAKLAAGITALGILCVLAGKFKELPWLGGIGTVMFFGGVVWYYAERMLFSRKRKTGDDR